MPFAWFSRERRKHGTLTLVAVDQLRQNGVLRVVFPPAQMIAVLVELRIYRVPQLLVDDGLVLAVVNRAFVPHRSCIKDIGQQKAKAGFRQWPTGIDVYPSCCSRLLW